MCVCMHVFECVSLSHLADAVYGAGGHWQVSNRSSLRGAALQTREEKALIASHSLMVNLEQPNQI